MKGYFIAVLAVVLMVSVSGCVTVQKVVRERVDQEPSGNRGFLQGNVPTQTREVRDREYIDIKVEMPTWQEVKKGLPPRAKSDATQAVSRTPDKAAGGNKGYINQRSDYRQEPLDVYQQEQPKRTAVYKQPRPPKEIVEEPIEQPIPIQPANIKKPPMATTYTVVEGDNLTKISKNIYGKASKWTLIYEANADKIKNPDKLKVGTVLTIPELKETKQSQDIK